MNVWRYYLKSMSESAAKRVKLSGPLIGTHNGHFHADEALAVYMLRLLPTYTNSPLVRTRDAAKLKECHTVVDVGGQYEPSQNRYDHHQREFSSVFPGHTTKLSSAGLVFLHLGKSIIAQQTGLAEDSDEVAKLHEKLYTDFIEAFDANDNGISAYETGKLQDLGISKRFNDRGFSIAACVNRFNYYEPASSGATASTIAAVAAEGEQKTPADAVQAVEDERFGRASAFTGQQFLAELTEAWKSWLPARKIVTEAFAQRTLTDASGQILVLPWREQGLPWSDHLYTIEKEHGFGEAGAVLYVLFPETGEPDSKWRVRAVSLSSEGFELRKPLPEPWRGVRDEQLDAVAGVSGCVFVHASGFIAGNKTYEGALQMAQKALQM